MIDCSKTENYFKEKARMTKYRDEGCNIKCRECPFSNYNNGANICCDGFELTYPDKAIAIVQKWSDEHPQKTILQDFLEKYPNSSLTKTGFPERICPYDLGYEEEPEDVFNCFTEYSCKDCWNRPLNEVTK